MRNLKMVAHDSPEFRVINLLLKANLEQKADGVWRYKKGWTDEAIALEASKIIPVGMMAVSAVRYELYGPSRIRRRDTECPQLFDEGNIAARPTDETAPLLREILQEARQTNELLRQIIDIDQRPFLKLLDKTQKDRDAYYAKKAAEAQT